MNKIKNAIKAGLAAHKAYEVVILLGVSLLLGYEGCSQLQIRNNYNGKQPLAFHVKKIYKVTLYKIKDQYRAEGFAANRKNVNQVIDVYKKDYDEYKDGMILKVYPHKNGNSCIYAQYYDESFLSFTLYGFFIPGYLLGSLLFLSVIPLLFIKIDKTKISRMDGPVVFIMGIAALIVNKLYLDNDPEINIYSAIILVIGAGLFIYNFLNHKDKKNDKS